MAIYVGEAVTVLCTAIDPTTGLAISTADAEVEFYAPPKNPPKVPADRTSDHGPFAMTWTPDVVNKDESLGAYVVFADTTGWLPGKWFYKTTLSGAFESWEYANFTLVA